MSVAAGGAVALAAALDRTLAEPPERLHPVVWIGRCIDGVDRRLPDRRLSGVALALALPAVFATLAGAIVLIATAVGPVFGLVVAGLILFSCSSHRMLVDVAHHVIDLSERDLDGARTALRALAGREAAALSAAEVRSAAVESAAENLSDGLVAPLMGFAGVLVFASTLEFSLVVDGGYVLEPIGNVLNVVYAGWEGSTVNVPLAIAIAGAVSIKVVNTADSMLGYREREGGWGPARLDDVVMWVPARTTALLLACVYSPSRSYTTLRRARARASETPSPNSGWPMATVAAALRVRLTKPTVYVLFPDRDLPSVAVAESGIRLVSRTGWIVYGITALIVVFAL